MRPAFQRISPQHATDLILRSRAGIMPLALFDVRDPDSYARAHIRGADHLTESAVGSMIGHLPATTPIMIYCYHGNASQIYAQMFSDFRFGEVYSVDGGFEALAAALAEPPKLPPDASIDLENFLTEFKFDPQDLNAPWDFGLTPLMRAALLGRDDLVEELLEYGVNIHLRNSDGNNALWLACVSSNQSLIKRLITAGIHMDNCNLTGATPLMYTASSGKAEIMALLLEAGADPYIANFDDYRAVDLAATEACLRLLRHTAN